MIVALTALEGTPAGEEAKWFADRGGVSIGQCYGLDGEFFSWVRRTFGDGAHVHTSGAGVCVDADGCRFHLRCRA